MEAAKAVFTCRNGSRNPDGSPIGWNVWQFHLISHKAMDLLLYGWSENMSTQSGESVHKVLLNAFVTHCYTWKVVWFQHLILSNRCRQTLKPFNNVRITKRSFCVWSNSTQGDRWSSGWSGITYDAFLLHTFPCFIAHCYTLLHNVTLLAVLFCNDSTITLLPWWSYSL